MSETVAAVVRSGNGSVHIGGNGTGKLRILEEALAAVVEREGQYGHALDHFGRTATALTARFMSGKNPLFARPMTPQEWPLMVAIDKLVGRGEDTTNIKRDSLVDTCGYADRFQEVIDEQQRRR